LFFLEDGSPISNAEVTRRRRNETLARLPQIRHRGLYHARHPSVSRNLMIGKNLLWMAEQHGRGVQVMLNMYVARLKGAIEGDLESIREAMQSEGAWDAAHGGGAEPTPGMTQPELRPKGLRKLASVWR
jgi:hypothetical protein